MENGKMKINIESITSSVASWVNSLTDRTLQLAAIVILHLVFLPATMAYLNGLTDKLPALDTYILVVAGLVVMMLLAIKKNDQIAILLHVTGFISQLVVFSWILLR